MGSCARRDAADWCYWSVVCIIGQGLGSLSWCRDEGKLDGAEKTAVLHTCNAARQELTECGDVVVEAVYELQ